MDKNLWQYIYESYYSSKHHFSSKIKHKNFIQIDDQDDFDNITEFCNIFITLKTNREIFELELLGKVPVTKEISELAQNYHGFADLVLKRIVLVLTLQQLDIVTKLAFMLRKTVDMGDIIGNPQWPHISARTISSLNRFVRIMKEYRTNHFHLSKITETINV